MEELLMRDIGIPNVPAIIWAAEQKRNRERLDAGLCPVHNTPLRVADQEEICDECEDRRSGREY